MKIAFIEHNPYPDTVGGSRTYIKELGKALQKRGHEVKVLTTDSKWYRKYSDCKSFLNKISYFFWRLWFIFYFSYTARIVQNANEYDLVLAQNPLEDSFAARKPFVLVLHGIHNKGFKSIRGKLLSLIPKLIENKNITRANKIVCVNKEIADFYKCETVIHNGVDFSNFSIGVKEDKSLLFVGRFSKEKNIINLIKAMNLLPDYHLNIIGTGPLLSTVREILTSNCTLIGEVSQEEISKYYAKSKFIVIPSEFESGPLTLLEGMASGCIPVITKVGIANEFIKTKINGYLLEDYSPEEIAKTIKEADKFDCDINYIRDSINELSWDNIAEKYEKLETQKIRKNL